MGVNRTTLLAALLVLACTTPQQQITTEERALQPAARALNEDAPQATRLGFGRAATQQEIMRWDIDVRPDGRGLPSGSGTPPQGAQVYAAKCQSCHGAGGEGVRAAGPALVGPPAPNFDFGASQQREAQKTIGNYWPYATTIFDYVRRTMPFDAPGSLSDAEVYAVTAFLLWKNGIIAENSRVDARSLPRVRMPARDRFVPDDREASTRVK